MDRNDEDFGQTLGVWGVHAGPFLELPLLGPSDLRDAPARLVDAYSNPAQYIKNTDVKYGLYGLRLVKTRADLLPLDRTLKGVFDPYAFIRDAYLQQRAYKISGDSGDSGDSDAPAAGPRRARRRPAEALNSRAEQQFLDLAQARELLHLLRNVLVAQFAAGAAGHAQPLDQEREPRAVPGGDAGKVHDDARDRRRSPRRPSRAVARPCSCRARP